MKPVSVLILALLFSSSLYASATGRLGMCIYKDVTGSSRTQVYYFQVDYDESQCMDIARVIRLKVEFPPHAKPGLYCDPYTEPFETINKLSHMCLIKNSYIKFNFWGEGGSSEQTSGELHIYGPPDHNEAWFEGDVDTSLHLCLGKGNCGGQKIDEFHNGDTIYVVYNGRL